MPCTVLLEYKKGYVNESLGLNCMLKIINLKDGAFLTSRNTLVHVKRCTYSCNVLNSEPFTCNPMFGFGKNEFSNIICNEFFNKFISLSFHFYKLKLKLNTFYLNFPLYIFSF